MAQPTDAILGNAPSVDSLRTQIRRLAAFDAPGNPRVPTTLLQGDTGTGKGLVARVIHDSGPRSAGPFVEVNCAAIPEAMLEAELFGFEAGAFTDAKRAKPGLFEAASGGTLFLDEIDSLPLALQGKVLKAIEDKRVRRLGAVTSRDVDVKLIAATQHDLKAFADAGGFRADLYHRLAVLILTLQPLREREGDVPLLAAHFLERYAEAHGLAPKHLNDSGRAWLTAYDWPGNVRELGHLMERVTLLSADDEVTQDTLAELSTASSAPDRIPPDASASAKSGAPSADDDAHDDDESVERLRAALERAGGNVARAARALGIGRNALRYRMRRLGIERPDDTAPALPPRAAPAAPRPQRVPTVQRAPTPPPAAPPPQPVPSLQPASWEQKPVAVLVISLTFPTAADVPGYEPWTVATHWERAIAERVEGFGGALLQRTASRLTAVFGVPRTLEQMPERATLAALAIRRAVADAAGTRPDVRVAVHLGEARIDTAAADPLAQLFPIADALALPERLLGHAGSGEVLVSPAAARRVERTCELHARGLQLGPSEGDRLTAYAVVRQRARLASADSVGDRESTRFIGRHRELDLLSDAFARATAGNGQVVFLAGDAGIGKSRLLAELRHRLADRPHQWFEGRCASYGTRTPFLPIIDGLRRYVGIDDQDDDASAAAKIQDSVEQLGADYAWTLPFVRQLLSLKIDDDTVKALDAASRRSELFRALRALSLRAAELAPLVMVIEDLHWIDPASEEYLTFLGDIIPTARVLLILSHRTGYTTPLPDRSYHVRIALPPLSGGEMAAMTGCILGTAEMPAALQSLIADKAEGNPFFLEELSRSLVEDGALRTVDGTVVLARELHDISVPNTVQDVLFARIDRLAEDSRRAIQVASVIGREFALRLLARISEAGDRIRTHVDELRSLELIYEKALHPELAYMFKHALTHDVAYESVVLERRQRLHCTIGQAVEELYADRIAEHYETLAHHFSRGADWERAITYHELSAEKATEAHASRAAVEHCRQALTIAERLGARVADETRRRLSERLGRACFYLSEYAASAAAYEDAAARSTDLQTRALHLSGAGFSHFWAHHYEPARRCIDAAIDLSRTHQLPVGEAMGLGMHGFFRVVHDARIDEYDDNAQQALAICARHPHGGVEAFAHFERLMAAEWTGDYTEALAHAEAALSLSRQLRLPDIIIFTTWFLGKARCCLGDFGGAIAMLGEAYELCDRLGDRAWKSRLANTLGWCYAEIGSVARARESNERAAALAREIGDPEILSNADINLATNHLAVGDIDRALSYLEPIESVLARPGDPWMRWRYRMHAQHVRGEVELARNEPGRTLVVAAEQLENAQQYRAPKIAARALLLQASAQLALERREAAEASIRAALEVAARIGYQRAVWQAHRLLAETARRNGDTTRAAEHRAQARAAAERAARSLTADDLRGQLIAMVTSEG